jgi:uracil-DNA glycosylase family 4
MGWEPRQLAYLGAMGIDVWVRRDPALPPAADPGPQAPRERRSEPALEQDSVAAQGWEALRHQAQACTLCGLHETRTQVVFGVGDEQADWLFVGEAPGADEDRQGEPFVGRAGQLLNAMLLALGLSRERVYIANILKCRPPRNRDPRPEEAQACRPYLQRQIELLTPRVIVALGRIAAQNLLQTDIPIGRLRGRRHVYGQTGIPVVVTYHPAYLLRSPLEKRKAWQDLCLARGLAGA